MKKLLLIVLLAPLFCSAQEGVNFEHNQSWQQVQAKAKAAHKYIFMDCYTTWCGPCKYMTSTIFPQKVVADVMNDKFINVKVQLDTTDNDNAEVKSWYQTGHDLSKQYNVRAYPTYLIFDENGKIVHRFVGASPTSEHFVTKLNAALDPDKQYYTLLDKYNAGEKDPEFVRKFALIAQDAYEKKQASELANAYLATQQNLYTKDNLDFVISFTETSKDKGFDMLLHNGDKVDAAMGKKVSNGIVQNIISRENVYPVIFPRNISDPKDLAEPDWTKLQNDVAKNYPAQAKEVISHAQVVFYENKKDWDKFGPAVVSYMKEYGSNASPEQLNDFAWNVFLNCSDMACVEQALAWSKRSIDNNEEPMFMDTYANILYKMGKKDEAIEWETKAMNLETSADKSTYEQTLSKMKNGEKTWN